MTQRCTERGAGGEGGRERWRHPGSGQLQEGTRKGKEMTASQAWVKAPVSLNCRCVSLTLDRIGVGVAEDKWLRSRDAEPP